MTSAAKPLAAQVGRWREEGEAPLIIGLCGSQGSGKSTVAAETARLLSQGGRSCGVLALDDFYLTKAERHDLARAVHPLLAVRGPPGTHDVAAALTALRAARAGTAVRSPRFDKLADDRDPESLGRSLAGQPDVILFEGWCVGAVPQPEAALAEPINALEREKDADGVWRRYVNAALATSYRTLFAQLDRLVLLQAPSFDVVLRWRLEQEEANARAADPARRAMAMDEARVARFIQHYERITRWMLAELPGRADLVISLDEDRGVAAVKTLAG